MFDYSSWPDPPVLFRKDEVLPSDHPKLKLFRSMSSQLKQAGILPSAEARFTKESWAKTISELGYQIRGHKLVSSDNSRAIQPFGHRHVLHRGAKNEMLNAPIVS